MSFKVCVLTIARYEYEHIEEFCNHYFNEIGVDHIFWIDNNTPPLQPVEINDERVTVIRKNDVNWCDGRKPCLDYQNECLNSSLKEYVYGNYDWCIYVDVDELLDLNGVNIHRYINSLPFGVDFVPVQWVVHGNNYYIFDSELPFKTMRENYGWTTNWVGSNESKAIFKVYKNSYIDIYYPYNRKVVRRFIKNHKKIFFDDRIRVHHYRIQSIEHYIRHKILNGIYGSKSKPRFVTGFFDSSQFKKSNPKMKFRQYDDLMTLLRKYNIHLSQRDDIFLKKVFKRR